MTGPAWAEPPAPEAAAREHARRVAGRDPTAWDDVAPSAVLAPPELLDWLLQGSFRRFELVAHARIGAHHIFKIKYVGPTTVVVQARWVRNALGTWQIVDAEIARINQAEAAS